MRLREYGRKVCVHIHRPFIVQCVFLHDVCVCVLGNKMNKQHTPSLDHQELARETERLDRELERPVTTAAMLRLYCCRYPCWPGAGETHTADQDAEEDVPEGPSSSGYTAGNVYHTIPPSSHCRRLMRRRSLWWTMSQEERCLTHKSFQKWRELSVKNFSLVLSGPIVRSVT